jgi:hypothetical protein
MSRSWTRAALAALLLSLVGCATRWDGRDARTAMIGAGNAPAAPWAGQLSPPWGDPGAWGPPAHGPEPGVMPSYDARAIPGGEPCLAELGRMGVAYRRMAMLKGVQTPVHVTGPLGGLRFTAGAGLPLYLDCRMAVALAWTAPHLLEMGVTEVRFSGAYVFRSTRSGRPSRHALGLAIDIHALTFTSAGYSPPLSRLEVKRDFRKGIGSGCAPDAPRLNQVACRLKQLGLYRELLTPDYDRDHHDHFHLAIWPL